MGPRSARQSSFIPEIVPRPIIAQVESGRSPILFPPGIPVAVRVSRPFPEIKGMILRIWGWSSFIVLISVSTSIAAGRATSQNFVVSAPTQEIAEKFAEAAENFRIEKAREWLGRELPPWSQRCPIVVRVNLGEAGGATTFTFTEDNNGRSSVGSRRMEIKGKLDQLLNSVLPHEITHTILADHFGRPVPRWADEGGSVLSENDEERINHDIKARQLLNSNRAMRLRYLFSLKDYPDDMIVVYAEGFSISQYLIDLGGRKKFLDFIGQGMQRGNRNWEAAVRDVYGLESIDLLEQNWIDSLKKPRVVAAKSGNQQPQAGQVASRGREVRSDAAPGVPLLDPPVTARGVAPGRETYRPAPAPVSGPKVRSNPAPVTLLAPPEPLNK